MAEPLRVAVRRGQILECVHEVHAVAVRDGELVAACGEPGLVTSLRSSAKPIQALPLAREYLELDDEQVAIAAASHFGTPRHVEAVRRLLEATGGREDELDCGRQAGRPPEPIYHNCSGKHAAMLAVCRANRWPVQGYRQPDHPLQQALVEEIAGAADLDAAEVETGPDGCGVVCFALSLERVAHAFGRLERLDGGARVAAAMRLHPTLIGGEGATDTELMRTAPGWIAKAGAEGLMSAASPEGLGLAVKVVDGNARALRPALAAFAEHVDLHLPAFREIALPNMHGEAAATISLL